jgi:hypothetical protein
MAVEPRRYRFGPLEQRGVIIGLRGGQIAVLAVAGVVAVGLFRTARASGLVLAVVVFGAATVTAFVPVRGATLEQWAPTLLHWSGRAGRRRWLADRPGASRGPGGGPGGAQRRGPGGGGGRTRVRRPGGRPRLPPGLDGLAIFDAVAAGDDKPIGIVHDRRGGMFSAVLEVRGGAFALLDVADKERRLATWATVLAALGRAGSAVARLQWIERTFPAGSHRLPLPPAGEATGQRGQRGQRAARRSPPPGCVESYAELIEEAGPATQEHETFLVVTMHAREISRAARHDEGGVHAAAAAVVGREMRLLQGQLRTADLTVERVLNAAACERALRRSFAERPEPEASPHVARPSRWPWPVATEATWAAFRTDGVWHATYWIAEWPRVEVGPDFLAPLLLQSVGRRTVAVTMVPTNPLQAARSVEAAKTAEVADGELRRRAGFLNTARRERESEHLFRRESELAEGHADYGFAGYVTVSAADPDELQRGCAEAEQLAHQAHLELRRLYGRQDDAFTWTLPLGRGLS